MVSLKVVDVKRLVTSNFRVTVNTSRPLDEVDIPEEECNVEETSFKEDQYEMVKESDVEIHI